MYYAVEAKLISGRARELHRLLADGTIARQKPDGREIVESMARARIDPRGVVRWSEVCYCDTPLAHERETVLNRFFSDIQTEEVDDYVQFQGEPLMEQLAQLALRDE